MFGADFKESGQSEVPIKSVKSDILQQLIKFCYGGEIVIDSTNIDDMTKSAAMLQFTEVQEECADLYSTNLSASNCLGVRNIADVLNMKALKEKAHAFVLQHFVEVSKADEFLQLGVDQVSELMKDDEIYVEMEEDVFGALIGWVKYDLDGRKESVEALLGCVRLQHMKKSVSKSAVFNRRIRLSSMHFLNLHLPTLGLLAPALRPA